MQHATALRVARDHPRMTAGRVTRHVPLAAKLPSSVCAAGSDDGGIRVHVAPPSLVVSIAISLPSASPITMPRFASQNDMQS